MADYKLPIITGTSLAVGDLLRWNGAAWVNYPDSNYIGHPRSACSVYLNVSQDIASEDWTKVEFDTVDYDLGTEFDHVTDHEFTAAVTGYYHVTFNLRFFESMNDGDLISIKIIKDSANIAQQSLIASVNTFFAFLDIAKDVYLTAGQTLHGEVFHDFGANRELRGTNYSTYFTVHRITY